VHARVSRETLSFPIWRGSGLKNSALGTLSGVPKS
jgi:hypothetical protein